MCCAVVRTSIQAQGKNRLSLRGRRTALGASFASGVSPYPQTHSSRSTALYAHDLGVFSALPNTSPVRGRRGTAVDGRPPVEVSHDTFSASRHDLKTAFHSACAHTKQSIQHTKKHLARARIRPLVRGGIHSILFILNKVLFEIFREAPSPEIRRPPSPEIRRGYAFRMILRDLPANNRTFHHFRGVTKMMEAQKKHRQKRASSAFRCTSVARSLRVRCAKVARKLQHEKMSDLRRTW